MHHLKHSLLVATFRVELTMPGYRAHQVGGFYVGGFSEAVDVIDGANACAVSLDTFQIGLQNSVAVNTVRVDDSQLVVRANDMNTQAIYWVEADGKLVIFNDLFLARPILRALGIRSRYVNEGEPAVHMTFFEAVSRLRAGQQLTVWISRGVLTTRVEEGADLLRSRRFNNVLAESLTTMRDVLYQSVGTAVSGTSEVCIALSGGVDSGTVAALASLCGVKVHAWSLGTDWGNEFNEAQETADFLRLPLVCINVSLSELLAEMPSIVRFFHFVEPENIEIALVAHCLYKKIHQQLPHARRFITGYGSDLINGGGVLSSEGDHAYHQKILQDLRRVQLSNEFSSLDAAQFNFEVHHPFWSSDVISCALRIPPSHKLRDGVDKFYLRQIAMDLLPSATAGRRKLGAHRGTGLSKHFAGAFGGASIYRAAIMDLHQQIFEGGEYK